MVSIDFRQPGFSFFSETLRSARINKEVVRSDYGPVIINYDELSGLLRHKSLVHDPRRQLSIAGVDDDAIEQWFLSLSIFCSAEEHKQVRRAMNALLATPGFSADCAAECTRKTAVQVDEGPCEFMADVANPIIDRIIASVCGVSLESYRPIAQAVRDIGLIHRMELRPIVAQVREGVEQLQNFLHRVVRPDCAGPADMPIRALLSPIIGFTPLRLSLGSAIVALAQNPDGWDALRDDPGFAERASMEVLRWLPGSPAQIRFATEPIELRQGLLRSGDSVLLCAAQGNRDGEPDGDEFIPDRRPLRPHLSFGGGPHHCLGAAMTRSNMPVILRELSSVFEKPEVTGEVAWMGPSSVYGPTALPVELRRRVKKESPRREAVGQRLDLIQGTAQAGSHAG